MKMWPWMQLGTLLTLILGVSIEATEIASTINHVWMESVPDWRVQNGQNLTLNCIVDVSTTSQVKPQRTVLFYRNDEMIYSVSSTKDTESMFIPQVRVHDSGIYRCSVILNNHEETTKDYVVAVKGVPSPQVTLDKKEATEGEEVAVTCSVEEERGPIHFTIEKLELDTQVVKQEKEKFSRHDNFVTIKFTVEEQDHILFFTCQAGILSVTDMEMSESTRSELVTVREVFSVPTVHVSPPGLIKEGDELKITCAILVMPWAPEDPELLIQKDKEIVANGYGEITYSVKALVDHSSNYTCKGQAGRVSKVRSIEVKVTA